MTDPRNLFNALQFARKETDNPDLSTLAVLVLLTVARFPNIPMKRIEQEIEISQAAVSRNVTSLGDGDTKIAGLKLLRAFEDPEYRRQKLVILTPKGERFLTEMLAA